MGKQRAGLQLDRDEEQTDIGEFERKGSIHFQKMNSLEPFIITMANNMIL